MTTAAPPLMLPNPETPLAWLPPDIAAQLQASDYVFVGTLGAWIWDLLMSLGEEYAALRRHLLSLPNIVYIIARLFSLLYIITATIFQVGNVGNCQQLLVAIGSVGTVAVPANSFLMYLRVRAVYNDSVFVKTVFGIFWVGVLGACVTAPFSLEGGHIGTTQRCIDTNIKAFGAAGLLAAAINDTLIFLVITYRLLTFHTVGNSWSDRLKGFSRGEGMHKIPKLLLQTGQLYYAATAGMNIFTVISVMSSGFPPIMRAMFTVPNVALSNAMACRVFRQLKLGLLNDNQINGVSGLSQRTGPIQMLPPSQYSMTSRGRGRAHNESGNTDRTVAVDIQTSTVATDELKELDNQWKNPIITELSV